MIGISFDYPICNNGGNCFPGPIRNIDAVGKLGFTWYRGKLGCLDNHHGHLFTGNQIIWAEYTGVITVDYPVGCCRGNRVSSPMTVCKCFIAVRGANLNAFTSKVTNSALVIGPEGEVGIIAYAAGCHQFIDVVLGTVTVDVC